MKKIVILLALITFIGCGNKNTGNSLPKKENTKIVKSLELNEQSLDNIKNYNGELKPKIEMKIVTSTGGDVEEVYFKNGDRVKKGEVIVKLFNADVEAGFYEAQGQLLKAKSTYSTEKISFEKNKKLYERDHL